MFAGGVLVAELAEQALSAIGFSRHTTEDRKIVNENTARSKVLTVHLKGVERAVHTLNCLLYTSPSPRDKRQSRMPSSA